MASDGRRRIEAGWPGRLARPAPFAAFTMGSWRRFALTFILPTSELAQPLLRWLAFKWEGANHTHTKDGGINENKGHRQKRPS